MIDEVFDKGDAPGSLTRTVARNAIFSALAFFVSTVVLVVLTPYIINKLGVEAYGIWVLILVVTGYAGLSDLGIGISFQKFIAEYHAQKKYDAINAVINTGFAFYALLGMVLIVAALMFVKPVMAFLDFPSEQHAAARDAFIIAVVNLSVGNPLSVFSSLLSGMQLIDLVKKVEVSTMAARVVLYIVVLENGFGIQGLVISESVLLMASSAVSYLVSRKVFPHMNFQPWRFEGAMFRTLLAYGGKLQVSRLSELVNFQFDRIIVSKFLGLHYVVFADIGGKLLSRMRVLPLVLLSSLIPAVAQLHALNQQDRVRLAFERSTKYLAALAVPLFVFVAAFAHPIITLWFDSTFVTAAYTMQILAIGYLFNVLTGSISYIIQGTGNVAIQMKTALIQTVANVVLSLLFVYYFGYYGVMVGTTIALIIGALWFTGAFERQLPGSSLSVLKTLTLPLLSAVGGGICTYIVWSLSVSRASGFVAEALVLTACGFFYLFVYSLLLRTMKYFDVWDAEFLTRVSPKLAVLKRIYIPQHREPDN